MRLEYTYVAGLPKLAWIAIVDLKLFLTRVFHGEFVEARENFFVEGIWNGPFEEGGFHQTECVFGSGAVTDGKELIFVPSGSTTDYLYYSQPDSNLKVSNSLPLLLATLGDALDPLCLDYAKINSTIADGIVRYQREIPTKESSVRRLMFNNLHVTADEVTEFPKPPPPHFTCFDDYRSYLDKNIALLFENARDPKRRATLEVLSTQSKGYDSTAINCIAANYGIDRVFTSPNSKETGSFFMDVAQTTENDDGGPICELLGLECVEIDRRSFLRDPSYELLYYAGLHENQEFNLQDIFKHLPGPAILLSGLLGEMWYKSESIPPLKLANVSPELKRWSLAGCGLSEIRLHTGFIHAPLPYLGGRRWPEIQKISDSPEMAPWRLDSKYDRPIPRRLGEEAGIPREMFGQKKLASVVDFPIPSFPYNQKLRKEFIAFLREHQLLGLVGSRLVPLVHRINNYIYWENPQHYFTQYRKHPLLYYINRAVFRLSGNEIKIKPLWRHLEGSLFCFSVNKLAEKYREILECHSAQSQQEISWLPINLCHLGLTMRHGQCS